MTRAVLQMPASEYARLALEAGSRAAHDPAVVAHLDIAYGVHEQQRLDVYAPASADRSPASLPVLLFIHGGGFTQGSKAWSALMAPLLASVPAVLVSIGYRLLPKVAWPVPLDDCRLALAWVAQHVASYGGDPQNLFVGGHSAGAALATLLALETPRQSVPIRGVVNVSGSFNRLAITGAAGSDNALPPGPMPIDPPAPLARDVDQASADAWLFIWGEREAQRERVERSSLVLMGRLIESGKDVDHLIVRDADHFDAHLAFADVASVPSRRLVAWMRNTACMAHTREENDASLVGMWHAVRYQVGEHVHALRGSIALSASHLVAAVSFDSDTAGNKRINANAGPYRLTDGRIDMVQWIQLHYDEAHPAGTLLTEDLPEVIEYRIQGAQLELTFPSGNRMVLLNAGESL